MKKRSLILISSSLLLFSCSSPDKPINIGNNEILSLTDCEKLHEDRQYTENKVEQLKNLVHRGNISDTLEQAANIVGILAGQFRFKFGETENERNKKLLNAYTERQTILDKQISLHCK